MSIFGRLWNVTKGAFRVRTRRDPGQEAKGATLDRELEAETPPAAPIAADTVVDPPDQPPVDADPPDSYDPSSPPRKRTL